MRKYYLHQRGEIWYCELVDPVTKRKLTAKSTGARTKDEAFLIVSKWINDGIPLGTTQKRRNAADYFSVEGAISAIKKADLTTKDAEKIAGILKTRGLLASFSVTGGKGSGLFEDFILNFWNYDSSPYRIEKEAHGHTFSKGHFSKSLSRAKTYWIPYFKGKRLAEITRGDIKAFSISLASAEKALSPSTRNRILVLGTTALKWAFLNEKIAEDVSVGVMTFTGEGRKRGVLTPAEVEKVFAAEWKDNRAMIGNLVAATTGLRAGEILALKAEDVGDALLFVRHSFSSTDGMKTPKNGEERRVPLIPGIKKELLGLASESPHGKGGFLFFSISPDRPIQEGALLDGLHTVLEGLEIDWKTRNIGFHSWRHYYSSRMADRIDARRVQLATGHKSDSVFASYSEHALEADLEAVGKAAADAFGKIIPFKAANE